MIELSTLAPSAYIEVMIQPTGALAGTHWPVRCDLLLEADGTCSLLQDLDCACTVSALGAPPQTVSLLTVFLSRVRDVTGRIGEELQNLPIPLSHIGDEVTRQIWSPLWPGALPSRGSLHYVNTNRPDDAALSFSQADVVPTGENLFIEVCGTGPSGPIVPKLFSVFWPDYVPRTIAAQTQQPGNTMWPVAEATPFLIYYHPSTAQNRGAGYYEEAYPESFDYLFYIHWANHDYANGPLAAWQKGLPYQLVRSRAHAVLVVPCITWLDREIGQYHTDGNFIVETLEEIQHLMLRRLGIFFCRPRVGRVALAGFSAGTQLVSNTLYNVGTRTFVDRVLKEVYMFDPSTALLDPLNRRVDAAAWFLGRGSSSDRADKMARVYTQIGTPQARARLGQFLGTGMSGPMGQGTVVRISDSPDGMRTAGSIPMNAWPQPDGSMGPPRPDEDVHQMIAGTMMTDALVRSGFNKQP